MNILLIEDNKKLASNVQAVLEKETYVIRTASTGQEGLSQATANNFDLIILDIGLPDIDGIEVCTTIRKREINTPILMLTARDDLSSKVDGLDCGADDYMTKPFIFDELKARIRALLRRKSQNQSSKIQIGSEILIDTKEKSVSKNDKEINISPTEYRIVEFLAVNKGEPKTATQIHDAVWGANDESLLFSKSLKVHVSRIRKKLGKNTIKTVQGFGYKM
ncbi:response regulator [Candidatus Dojkabacteria bacterium]|nr:response regulator [Candidatus Dojkabacteria bacterium]